MWGWRGHRGSFTGSIQFLCRSKHLVPKAEGFQEGTHRGSIESENRPITWPFETLHPTEQTDKKGVALLAGV